MPSEKKRLRGQIDLLGLAFAQWQQHVAVKAPEALAVEWQQEEKGLEEAHQTLKRW